MNKYLCVGKVLNELVERNSNGKSQTYITVSVYEGTVNGEKKYMAVDCVAFGERAKFALQYIGKGDIVAIEGKYNKWPKKDGKGNTTWIVNIVIDRIHLVFSERWRTQQEQAAPTRQTYDDMAPHNNTSRKAEAPEQSAPAGTDYPEYNDVRLHDVLFNEEPTISNNAEDYPPINPTLDI